ncbi:hypothetical protein AW40_27135 [Kosakonia radicincitans UMEnt01/12]|nr:hypothetical protein [Kosakonia radicincitans]KDE33557.1 hypothetical protein AW40_27135 [Kosakonia radicincitans UMEnt01/12]
MNRYATNTLVLITLALLASLMLMVSAARGEALQTGLNLLRPDRGNIFSEPFTDRAKGEALKDNPSHVSLTTAERWDGKLPASMVPGGGVPFISVK